MPNELGMYTPEDLARLFMIVGPGPLRFTDARELTDGIQIYGTADADGRKLTIPGVPEGKPCILNQTQITNILKSPGSDKITVMLESGETFEADPDGGGFNIPPSFDGDGQYLDSVRALEYYCPQIRQRIAYNRLTHSLIGDASLWAGGHTEEFGEVSGEFRPLILRGEKSQIPKILSKAQAMIKRSPVYGDNGEIQKFISVKPTKEQLSDYISGTAQSKPTIDPFVKLWKEPEERRAPMYDPGSLLPGLGVHFPTEIDRDEDLFYAGTLSKAIIRAIVEIHLWGEGKRIEDKGGAVTELLPILFGVNGGGKSSIAQLLAIDPDVFFQSWAGSIGGRRDTYPADDKALYYRSKGRVIIELEEGCGMSDPDRLKSDIGKRMYQFDEKYGDTIYPQRTSFFIATTESHSPLIDENRRLFPARVINNQHTEPETGRVIGDGGFIREIPRERIQSIYWVSADEYRRTGETHIDILKGIRDLGTKARRVSAETPIAVENIREALNEGTGCEIEGYTSENIIREWLRGTGLSKSEIDAGVKWWVSGGFIECGFAKRTEKSKSVRIPGLLKPIWATYQRIS